MGSFSSKTSRKKRSRRQSGVSDRDNGSDGEGEFSYTSDEVYDNRRVEKWNRMLRRNADEFLLNNLLMSIMFFENDFSRRNHALQSDNSKINVNLLAEHQKSHLKPDIMSEEVNRNVRFRVRHGEKKNVSQPLLPQRMVIIYHNIQIDQKEDEDHYSVIDAPTFKGQVEQTDRKGYLKLKCINPDSTTRKSSADSLLSNSTDESQSITNSGYETYIYGPINYARTPKQLEIQQHKQNLMKLFVREVKKKKEESEVKKKEESEDEEDEEEEEKKKWYSEYYMISGVLMRYFLHCDYQEELAKRLGFTEEDYKRSMYTMDGIFCSEEGERVHWEIIPAVLIAWPYDVLHGFKERPDRRTWNLNNLNYRWPTTNMVEEIQNQDCVVIPRGYFPKKEKNEEMMFEWEIAFPQAERYLEARLNHVHTRAYLFLVSLFKTYIEPKTERKGLLIDHIRNLIFWEVERNVISWPEDKLGTKLLKVMKYLSEALGHSSLSNYFIRERNIFENIPNGMLWFAQDVLDLVLQCPVMYFIGALRNLEYARDDFYKFPDLDKLRDILVNSWLKTVNPDLHSKHVGREGEQKKKKKKQVQEPRKSSDSLNYRWTMKGEKEDSAKNTLIITFFLDHFLTIVKDSIRHKALGQAKFYRKHCFYLNKLYKKYDADEVKIRYYENEIRNCDIEIAKRLKHADIPPTTPSRASLYQNERGKIEIGLIGSNRSVILNDGNVGSNKNINLVSGNSKEENAGSNRSINLINSNKGNEVSGSNKSINFSGENIVLDNNKNVSKTGKNMYVNLSEVSENNVSDEVKVNSARTPRKTVVFKFDETSIHEIERNSVSEITENNVTIAKFNDGSVSPSKINKPSGISKTDRKYAVRLSTSDDTHEKVSENTTDEVFKSSVRQINGTESDVKQNGSAIPLPEVNRVISFSKTSETKTTQKINLVTNSEDSVVLRKRQKQVDRSKSLKFENVLKKKDERSSTPILRLYTSNEVSEI